MDYRRVFRASAVCFVDLVSRVPADRWDGPGLGDWTLRELTGHTASSGLRQIPLVLRTPAETPVADSAAAYFALARSVPPEVYAAAVAASSDDARESAAELGDDPAATIGDLAGRATAALAAAGDDDLVTTAAGGMRVRDWIPTRTFELVVHGLDLAGAAGVDPGLPPEAVTEAALLATRIAATVGDGPAVLRALTGRSSLPEKFSVI